MVLLVQYTLIFASVLTLVALGGCFSEHSGVINLGLEGVMVMGALGGALFMRAMGGSSHILIVIGVLLVSALTGMVYTVLLGVACINFKADQTLVGTALNIMATAVATVIVTSFAAFTTLTAFATFTVIAIVTAFIAFTTFVVV